MKTIILTCAIAGVLAITGFTTFGQENKKTAEVSKDLIGAQLDWNEARIDSAADFKKFKKASVLKINDNENKIAELRTKPWNQNFNEQKINSLQKKNDGLKKQIEESDKTKTSDWTSFKREFNHDADALGRALDDKEQK